MVNVECNLPFNISHSTFLIPLCNVCDLRSVMLQAFGWRRMGSGGLRGLQNRCFGAEASKGWFDSDTPPPHGGWAHPLTANCYPLLFGRVGQESDLHRAALARRVHRIHCPI